MNFIKKCLNFYHYIRYIKLSNLNYRKTNDDKKNNILDKLDKKKFLVIKNFMTKKKCNTIIKKIDKTVLNKKIKTWSDSSNSDQRIFGAENLSYKIALNCFLKESLCHPPPEPLFFCLKTVLLAMVI